MSDTVTNISELLVKFDNGETAHLTTDNDHEWVVTCRPKEVPWDEWVDGVEKEVVQYIYTWTTLAGIDDAIQVPRLIKMLEEQLEWIKAYREDDYED